MNIQDRIAKLEKELAELKASYQKDEEEEWKPRVGEIVEMSDQGGYWLLRRYDSESDFGFIDSFGESWENCRPLNDPMVIQLIPHVPGDAAPCESGNATIVLYENGEYESTSFDLDWSNRNAEGYNIIGWTALPTL